MLMNSVESAGLTVSAPTIGVSPSGSIHGTARRPAGRPRRPWSPSPPQPDEGCCGDRDQNQALHEGQDGTDAARRIARTSTRASAASSSTDTHSSTACARSIPVVPAIAHGMPRAANRRMSAPHGTPTVRAGAPRSSVIAPGDDAHPRVVRGRLGGQERAAGPVHLGGRLAVVERARHRLLERRRARPRRRRPPARRRGPRPRPGPAPGSTTRRRPRARPAAGTAARSSRISGCATSALISPLERVQRRVHAHVAVDRRAALEPVRGVCGAAGHHAPEGERPRLRADDVEAGRLGDQRRVERRVALQLRERPEPAVLLGGDALQHDLRRRRRRPCAPPPARAARPPPRPSCRRRRGRAAGRPRARPTTARDATARCPARRRRRARSGTAAAARRPRSVAVSPHSSSRGASSPGWSGCARRAARSCACRSVARPRRGGQPGQRLEHRPLVPGDARDAQDRGRVAGERGGIDGRERGGFGVHPRHATWPIGVVSCPPTGST